MSNSWEYWANEMIKDKTIIRFLVYRKVYTPYEQEEKFMDESMYESSMYNFGIIETAFELPDGDICLRIRELEVDIGSDYFEIVPWSNYYKMSEIRLSEFDEDKKLKEYQEPKYEDCYNCEYNDEESVLCERPNGVKCPKDEEQ